MASIKDKDFRIPVIWPMRFEGDFPSGANHPIHVTGIDKETLRSVECVVKLAGAGRMKGGGSMRELLASLIALEFDLPIATPVIVEIDKEFLQVLVMHHPAAFDSAGFNFGTVYEDKFMSLGVNQKVPYNLLDNAAEILVFDILLKNADRTHLDGGKPNLLIGSKRPGRRELLIFDHELAFGFLFELPTMRSDQSWSLSGLDIRMIKNHCLFPSLCPYLLKQKDILRMLARLDDSFWDKAWKLIPEAWKDGDQFSKIRTHVEGIVRNGRIFVENIQAVLK